MNITIGTDPEMILTDRNNKVISAIPVLKHGKDNKIDLGDGFACYYDNTLIEANVPPSIGVEQLHVNIKSLFERMYKYLGNEYDLKAQASAHFGVHECEHPAAKEAGCSPEYCAYEIDMCYPPQFNNTFRSAGGHIHIGRTDYHNPSDSFLTDDDPYSKIDVVKMMDIFVGLPSILIDSNDPSKQRKQLYGQAGRHRPTPYGVEYRAISNFWLSSPNLVNLIYELTMYAVNLVRERKHFQFDEDAVRDAINNNKFELAEELCHKYIPKELMDKITPFINWNKFDIRSNWNIK